MHAILRYLTWALLALAVLIILWQAAMIIFPGANTESIQQSRRDSVHRIVPPQPTEQDSTSNLEHSQTFHSSASEDTISNRTGIPRQPTVDVFLLSASRDRERDLLIRYIERLQHRYEILRLFRIDTAIVDSTFRLIPVLEHWLATAPTTPVKRYRTLFIPIESYCRTDARVHAIIVGTMSTAAGAMIADLQCLRNRRNVSFTLALHRNLSYDIWKRALEDLAIPYYTIPNHEE